MNFEYFRKLFPEEEITPSKIIKLIELRNRLKTNSSISISQLRKSVSELGIDK